MNKILERNMDTEKTFWGSGFQNSTKISKGLKYQQMQQNNKEDTGNIFTVTAKTLSLQLHYFAQFFSVYSSKAKQNCFANKVII